MLESWPLHLFKPLIQTIASLQTVLPMTHAPVNKKKKKVRVRSLFTLVNPQLCLRNLSNTNEK